MDFPAPLADERSRTGLFERVLAGTLVAAVVGVWFLAAIIDPDPRVIGTHEQLGLAPCRLLSIFGIPCAFCGMTTAFSHLAHGDPIASIAAQPAGFAIALATVPAACAAFTAALSGTVPHWAERITASRFAWTCGLVILIAAWIYKIIVHS